MYINLKKQHIDYIVYLDSFYRFEYDTIKRNTAYRKYLEALLAYLKSFYQRSQPLFPLDEIMQTIEANFQEQLASKPNGADKPQLQPQVQSQPKPVSSSLEGVDDEEPPQQLPQQPSSDPTADKKDKPVYCDVCQKAFAKQSVYNGHLSGKKHQKAAQLLQVKTENNKKTNTEDIVSLEYKINMLCQLLEKKHTRNQRKC
jgi:splicing factor 3A subunit 3